MHGIIVALISTYLNLWSNIQILSFMLPDAVEVEIDTQIHKLPNSYSNSILANSLIIFVLVREEGPTSSS